MDVVLHPDAERAYKRLDAGQKAKLSRWADRLRVDPTAGDQIPQRLIPKTLKRKYDLTNLWRIELLKGHRGLYTIATAQTQDPRVIFIRLLDHRKYDRLFGYRTS